LDSQNESVEKFGKKSKLTEIFEYTVKTTFASQNFKIQYFSKISSTILLNKNNKNSNGVRIQNGGQNRKNLFYARTPKKIWASPKQKWKSW
jgi:hypothetical protein